MDLKTYLDISKNNKYDILFILGSGASVDSNLSTYRGPNGFYTNFNPFDHFTSDYSDINNIRKIWDFYTPLYKASFENKPGKTYEYIEKIINKLPNSTIITQNIDGFVLSLKGKNKQLNIIELHGNNRFMTCLKCNIKNEIDIDNTLCKKCNYQCRPDIILYNENINRINYRECCVQTKKSYKYIIIIGTTLQFNYLKDFINNSKKRTSKVIHINPDNVYKSNVKTNEFWIQKTAYKGLFDLYELLN